MTSCHDWHSVAGQCKLRLDPGGAGAGKGRMTKVERARNRVRDARTWRNEAWAEFAKAEMRLKDSEDWLAEAEYAARMTALVAA